LANRANRLANTRGAPVLIATLTLMEWAKRWG
jgi:hypothetical protein